MTVDFRYMIKISEFFRPIFGGWKFEEEYSVTGASYIGPTGVYMILAARISDW